MDDTTLDEVVETTEESSTSEEEAQTVPIDRFNKVYQENKELKEASKTPETKEKENISPDQQKEAQAKTYLKGLVKEELEEAKADEVKATKAEETKFDSDVEDVLAVNTEVDRDEFLKFMEEKSDKYSMESVTGAMALFKDFQGVKSETEEETKENLAKKPDLPKSEAGGAGSAVIDDSGKSIQEIAAELGEEAEAKGRG